MAEFTKGIWKVYESPFAPAVILKGKPNRPDRIIAVCRLERGSEGMTEAIANANLIAAAPETAEALQELIGFLIHDGLSTNSRLVPIINRGTEALLKGKEGIK